MIKAQLAGVPCICETTSLELTPMIEQPRIVLLSNPDNSSLRWEYQQVTVEEEIPPEENLVPEQAEELPPQKNLEPKTTNGYRSNLSRKKKSKNRIRLKKRRYKKYRGQCPAF